MRSLDERIASIPEWVLPATVAAGVAAMIGVGAYLDVRHDRRMDEMRAWYEQNPQVFELDEQAPVYRSE